MKVDGGLGGLADAGAFAILQERQGFDGLWSVETGHDPFLPLLLAAEATERVQLGTAIAVAFARNPMTAATTANDLQLASKGRHILGLGSQIKAHITRRFSMPWSHPAPRMREFVLAMRAIWDCWNNGAKLDFRGDFYSHTLMTPFFSPEPNPYGPPKVFVAAVGVLMTEVAGEVADGMMVHPLTSERYLKDVTIPAVERGLAKAGKRRDQFELSHSAFVVSGTGEEREAAAAMVRGQIAFYGSTPAYRGVLELHGWDDLQGELNALSKRGEWAEMSNLITDEMLETFAVVAPVDAVADRLLDRFGGAIDRISFYGPVTNDVEQHLDVVRALQRGR